MCSSDVKVDIRVCAHCIELCEPGKIFQFNRRVKYFYRLPSNL